MIRIKKRIVFTKVNKTRLLEKMNKIVKPNKTENMHREKKLVQNRKYNNSELIQIQINFYFLYTPVGFLNSVSELF